MFYKDHEIVACVQRSELWSIDDNGQLSELLGNCPAHEGYSVMYEVVDDRGRRSVSQIASIDAARAWIDAWIVAHAARST
jgi:hypothetical protein